MAQQELEVKLTGFQRFQLIKLWHKKGRSGDKEEFVKAVCKQKGILYTPPVEVRREV
jgi:hypothetical protein